MAEWARISDPAERLPKDMASVVDERVLDLVDLGGQNLAALFECVRHSRKIPANTLGIYTVGKLLHYRVRSEQISDVGESAVFNGL